MERKIGTLSVVDRETGEVIREERGAFTLQPAPPGTCPVCADQHEPAEPHNAESLHYQYAFYAERGRWPTWTDAMAHCTPEVRTLVREQLVAVMRKHGVEIPADLEGS
jgi:hypothetical protein